MGQNEVVKIANRLLDTFWFSFIQYKDNPGREFIFLREKTNRIDSVDLWFCYQQEKSLLLSFITCDTHYPGDVLEIAHQWINEYVESDITSELFETRSVA